MPKDTGIGAAVPRTEDKRLTSGQGRYVDDFNVPGQHYAHFVRSPHAHARIARLDDGVRVAVTGAGGNGVFRWAAAERALAAGFSPASVPPAPAPDTIPGGILGDVHAGPDYRAHLAAVMTRRAVQAAAA